MVPFVDLVREQVELCGELEAAIGRVLASGRFVLGPAVEEFELSMAAYLGVEYAVGVASGTDALCIALEALGIGRGDEVITSPFTFVSTGTAILHAGATPVFADIRPQTFTLDPAAVENAISPRTAAILPIHLFGQMAEMDALEAIAGRHGLAIVEDAAQAAGAAQVTGAPGDVEPCASPGVGRASRSGAGPASLKKAGAIGTAGCFSFYPTKNLGAIGEGGLVATDDRCLAERARRLRAHGLAAGEERPAEIGHNSRLHALQAAVLQVKLRKLDEWNERRRAHAAAYDGALATVPGITPPAVGRGNRHVYQQYTLRCGDRRRIRDRLEKAGVSYAVYYRVPLHLQEVFEALGYRTGDFPEAEAAASEVLSVPMFPGLTPFERRRVTEALGSEGSGTSAP